MKLHTTMGAAAMAVAMSSVAQAAFITGTDNLGGAVVARPSGGSDTASTTKAARIKTGMKERASDGSRSSVGLSSDTPVVFTAPGVFNPSTSVNPHEKLKRLKFKTAPSLVAAAKNRKTKQSKNIFAPVLGIPTIQQPSAPSGIAVPDGGSTAVLLGTCLLGLGALRRKL